MNAAYNIIAIVTDRVLHKIKKKEKTWLRVDQKAPARYIACT